MKGDIDSGIARESLKRISANFELELLRLIKTLNLISQSKELYKGQITFIQALTDKYKLGLSGFTIKLLDIERKSREPAPVRGPDDLFAPPGKTELSPASVAGIVGEIRDYLDDISIEIEKNKNEYLGRLDSVYSVYNLQLGASQTDLDLKLRELQKEISRISETNGSGVEEREAPGDVTGIDYVKPSLQQTETVKPRERNIDYIGPDEPKKQTPQRPAAQAQDAKPKPEIKSTARAVTEESDKDAKIKNSYILGAGLLILGIIVGVLFYDMLMRMWGVEEVSVVDLKTSTNAVSLNNAKPKIPPPAVKEKPAAHAAADSDRDKAKESSKLIRPPVPGDEKTVADADSAAVKDKSFTIPPQAKEPAPVPASSKPGASVNYTVIGVGANVRSGPGMGSDIVTIVKEGEVFKGLGEKHGRWVKIVASDGKEGWISEKVVRELK